MTDLKTFTFGRGSHETREDGLCVMEAVAYLAGEKHSDHPQCASVVITKLAIWVNDAASDSLRNELLRDMPWRIVGTKSTPEIEQQRAFMAADWAVRELCATMFRRAGFEAEAKKLEALPVIDSANASYAANAAYSAANAAYSANAAANAANAAYAAYAAANAANAAYAANAANAAANAAYSANAANAADDIETIIRSCVSLIDRMIRLTEPQERACEVAKPDTITAI